MVSESFDPTRCAACMEHYFDSPSLIEAAASVGIERGKSTLQILRLYLTEYHRNKHRKVGGG